MKYTDRFLTALSKTKELALSVEPFKFGQAIPIEEINSILRLCVETLHRGGYTDSQTLAGNCIPVHTLLNDTIRRSLDIITFITIGDRYWDEKDIYCEMSYEAISKELKNPDITKPLKAHTWLTLTDGTIIDFTSEAHLDIIERRGNHPLVECCKMLKPNEVEDNGYYRPFLIGAAFLFETGSVRFQQS